MSSASEPQNTHEPVTPGFIAAYLKWAWEGRGRPQTTLPLICYRGLANKDWELLPTLCRKKWPSKYIEQCENEVLTEFRSRFELDNWSDIEVLAYARHHGAPTRLMDWSRNPLVGLWFAVADKVHSQVDGAIYQLSLLTQPKHICVATNFQLKQAQSCGCGRAVHLFSSPNKIERTIRQGSVFTIASLENDAVIKPLDVLGNTAEMSPLRQYVVPATVKRNLRTGLAELGLDAYSIYGDPDSLGEKLSTLFDP